MIKRIIHKLAHLCHVNQGEVVMWWEGGILMVGFKCSGCGEIQDVSSTGIRR